jgi:hypothetical protein
MRSGKDAENRKCDSPTYIDTAIVEQVKLYGLTTRAAWAKAPIASSLTRRDIGLSFRRLTTRGILKSHRLHHGLHYFTLTKSEARRIGCETTSGGPFQERNKFQAYARLLVGLTHLPDASPLRLANKSRMLGPKAIGLPDTMMLSSDGCKIYWVRIDSSIRSQPSRAAQQLRTDIFRIVKIDSIRELIQERRFELVLVACTLARSNSILKHFRSYERVGATPIRTIIIPELIPLITSVQLGGPIQPSRIPCSPKLQTIALPQEQNKQ